MIASFLKQLVELFYGEDNRRFNAEDRYHPTTELNGVGEATALKLTEEGFAFIEQIAEVSQEDFRRLMESILCRSQITRIYKSAKEYVK